MANIYKKNTQVSVMSEKEKEMKKIKYKQYYAIKDKNIIS